MILGRGFCVPLLYSRGSVDRWRLLLLLAAAPLLAQDTVVHVDVKLVQVDATVTDSKGKHVGTLKAGDFVVLQDGKPQAITNFSYVAAPGALPAVSGAPAIGPQVGRAPLKTGDVRRMVALVVDDSALSFNGVAKVRDALHKFASRELQPGDMAAVIRTSAGMGALQQFTTDRTLLNKAIDQIKFTSGTAKSGAVGVDRWKLDFLVQDTMVTLRYVVEGLRDMPGRKSVVLFSENLPLNNNVLPNLTAWLGNIVDAANRASVVINAIDVANVSGMRGGSQAGLKALTEETGGLYASSNWMEAALDEAVADTDGYYLLGYRPDSSTFDSKTGAPLYHKIQVRLKVGGLNVRSRNGFFSEPDTARNVALNGHAALLHALNSPFAAGDVHVQLTTLFNQTPDKQSNLSALLHIDAHDLSFTAQPDGSRHASFEVAAETYGADGVHSDHSDRSFSMDLKPEQYEAALVNGVVYLVNQPVRAPGMYQMRVALRDLSSDRIGAANQFIEVPDLSKGRLTLSSVLLRQDVRGADAGVNQAEGQVAGDATATAAALRVFKPGSALFYDYVVFNAQGGEAQKADLEVQTRLFRDGMLAYTGQPMVPSATGEVASGRLLAGGHMTLANGISPGDYVLQVVVTDKLAKQKYQSASQAIDFEVAQ